MSRMKGITTTTIVAIIAVIVVVAGVAWYLTIPPAPPPAVGEGIPPDFFSDINVRKAIACLIDYNRIIEDVWLGEAKQVCGPMPDTIPFYNPDQQMHEYNVTKAEEYLRLAWDGTVWETGFTVTILYNIGNDQRRVVAEMISEGLANINPKFKAYVLPVTWPSYLKALVRRQLTIFVIGWLADFADAHNWVHPFMYSQGDFTYFQSYSNPHVDELIEEGIHTIDPERRRGIYYELQSIYYEDIPSIALPQALGRHYERDWVKGWYYNPLHPGTYFYALSKGYDGDAGVIRNPDTVIVATIGEQETLDPAWSYDTASGTVIFNVYEPLIFFDREKIDQFVPALATEVPSVENGLISEDGKTIIFPIRSGVKFHNGEILTPEDVEYSFERAMVQDRSGGPVWMLYEPLLGRHGSRDPDTGEIVISFEDIDNAVESNATHVILHLKEPYPLLPLFQILSQSWASILNKKFCIENGDWPGTAETWEDYNDPEISPLDSAEVMCGTGPFEFDRWEHGVQTVFVKNDEYWSEPASISQAIIKVVSEWATRKLMFLEGDADICYVPRMYALELEGVEGIRCIKDLSPLSLPAVFFNFDIDPESPYIGTGKLK